VKGLLALKMPLSDVLAPLCYQLKIDAFETNLQDWDRFHRVLGKHIEHFPAQVTVDLLYLTLAKLVEFVLRQDVVPLFFLSHCVDFVSLLVKDIKCSLILSDLVVAVIHIVLNLEKHIFELILHFELEALGPLGQARIFLVENFFVKSGPLLVAGSTKAQWLWEV
jgi:hypothetical protein